MPLEHLGEQTITRVHEDQAARRRRQLQPGIESANLFQLPRNIQAARRGPGVAGSSFMQWPGTGNFIKRLATEWAEDTLGDTAATLAFYGMLALFPFLVVVVGL